MTGSIKFDLKNGTYAFTLKDGTSFILNAEQMYKIIYGLNQTFNPLCMQFKNITEGTINF